MTTPCAGDLAAYVAGHRCDACRAAHTKWHAHRKLRILEGTWDPFTDPAPARAALARLNAEMTLAAIRRATGISITTLKDLRDHTTTKVRHEVADALISLTPTTAHDSTIDATGTRRRIQALAAMGWSFEAIGHELGLTVAGVSALTRRERVTARTAARVREVFRRWAMRIGPSEIARARARDLGWQTAAASDDIDDPDEDPAGDVTPGESAENATVDLDPAVLARLIGGDTIRLPAAERVEAVRQLSALGYSAHQIASRCGVGSRTIVRDRTAHGITTNLASRYDVRRTA